MTTRRHTRSVLFTALVAAPLVVAGCSSVEDPGTTTAPRAPGLLAAPASLQPFSDCDALLEYYQSNALDRVGPWGLDAASQYWLSSEGDAATDSADGDSGGNEAASPESGDSAVDDGSFSGTNNQEAGVDEADSVKTDGEIIVSAVTGSVTILDVATETTTEVDLPRATEGNSELLLQGDTLLVLTSEYSGGHLPMAGDSAETSESSDGPVNTYPAFGIERTVVTTVDLTDPGDPQVLGSTRMEGSYRSARMIDGTVRMVMVSQPQGVTMTSPDSNSLRAEDEAEQRNRELIENSTIEDWLPHAQTLDAEGNAGSAAPLVDCGDVTSPASFSGFAMVSVLSFDLTDTGSTAPDSSASLIGDGSTVYASTDALIVATSPWAAAMWEPEVDAATARTEQASTDLHVFDISDPDGTDYLASGRVEGRLLNQFALSESDGVIRAATTLDATREEDSQSSLIMMAIEGEELVETGRLDGLGVDERIYAVRYLSPDLASVVTFREVDPLYLVDTSDPSSPELLGELKIPGYSAYLHPIDDQYLLGVGQDVDEDTGEMYGTQVSLFDISDLTNPQRVSQVGWDGAYSAAEWDHRAFTYWPETGQAFLPMEIYNWREVSEGDEQEEFYSGVVAVSVDTAAGEVSEQVRTEAPDQDWAPYPARTIVIGEDLWAIGWEEISRLDLATLQTQSVIPMN